jgi:hypothetical protein
MLQEKLSDNEAWYTKTSSLKDTLGYDPGNEPNFYDYIILSGETVGAPAAEPETEPEPAAPPLAQQVPETVVETPPASNFPAANTGDMSIVFALFIIMLTAVFVKTFKSARK